MIRRIAIVICVTSLLILPILSGCRQQQAAAPETPPAPPPTEQPAPPEKSDLASKLGGGPEDPLGQRKPVALSDILPSLKSADPNERYTAISALSRVAGKADRAEALRLIKQAFDTEKDAGARGAAIGAMNAFPLAETKAYYIRATRDPSPNVREFAVVGLFGSPDPDAANVLMECMKDASAAVRSRAVQQYAQGLKNQGVAIGAPKLINALRSDSFELRAQATMALVPMGRDTIPYLIKATPEGPATARASVVAALGIVAGGTSPRQAQWAKQVASDFKVDPTGGPPDERATPVLIQALKDPDFRVRLAAAQGLGFQGNAEAAKACAGALRDPNVEVRRRAASALTVLPPEAVQGEVIAMLRDQDPAVRRYGVGAVSGLPAPVAVPALVEFIGRETETRALEEAADRLGDFKDKSATPALVGLFDNPGADVRWAAVRAVGKFEDPQAIEPLRRMLKDRTAWVAFSAEQGLHKLRIQASAPRGVPDAGAQ